MTTTNDAEETSTVNHAEEATMDLLDEPRSGCRVALWLADHADNVGNGPPAPVDALQLFVIELGTLAIHAFMQHEDDCALAIVDAAMADLEATGTECRGLDLARELVRALVVDDVATAVRLAWQVTQGADEVRSLGCLVGAIYARLDGGGLALRNITLEECVCATWR